MESLSTYAKRFVAQVAKPDVDFVFGLSPVISIEQKTTGNNPRSTVGTMTDIAGYLNLLFAPSPNRTVRAPVNTSIAAARIRFSSPFFRCPRVPRWSSARPCSRCTARNSTSCSPRSARRAAVCSS